MLRVVKLRSAMSLGTWGITLFGLCLGFTAAHQAAHDGLFRWFPAIGRLMKAVPVKALEVLGSILGVFVASYTGVLLSSTAVPLWGRAKHILGPLFLTSGLSAALASLTLLLSPGRSNRKTLEKIEDSELVALTTELGLILALPPTLGPLSKPLFQGKLGRLFVAGAIGAGTVLPLGTRLAWKLRRKPTPRSVNVGTSLLVLIGGIILRTVWVVAGRRSADDPQAVNYYNTIEEKRKR
jgi:formate-dependent nitrite reductase membrane component NrfD